MKIENDCVVIELNDIWEDLPAETKAEFLQEAGAWEIIEQELLYLQGRSLSTPSFNNSIHKVRKLILTDPQFVDDMLINFVGTILDELATAKQDEYAARSSFWKLYHHHKKCNPTDSCRLETPLDVIKDENPDEWSYRPRVDKVKVQAEVLDLFQDIISEFQDRQERIETDK